MEKQNPSALSGASAVASYAGAPRASDAMEHTRCTLQSLSVRHGLLPSALKRESVSFSLGKSLTSPTLTACSTRVPSGRFTPTKDGTVPLYASTCVARYLRSARGQDNGQYDQHGKQDGIDKNAPAGCGRPPEQDQSKNAANERGQRQKGLAAFLAHCHRVAARCIHASGLGSARSQFK